MTGSFAYLRAARPVQVEPKVLRLLLYLIENRNRLVRKQELLDKVWPDAMVTENALTRVVGLLRKALNDDSHVPRFLETVPTAGYRFIAKVTVVEENPVIAPPVATKRPQPLRQARRDSEHQENGSLRLSSSCSPLSAPGYFSSAHHRKPVPTEKATVVLADFDNSTGDPVFDSTLRQSLAVQLEQSPFVTMTDDRIQGALRMMGQPTDARLTPAIAREICVRTSSAVVVDGSIASLGAQYVLGLRATDCRSGKIIAQEQVQAARKEDVLGALDRIASKLRARVRRIARHSRKSTTQPDLRGYDAFYGSPDVL